MSVQNTLLSLFSLLLFLSSCSTPTSDSVALSTQMDSIAYAVGMDIGKFYHDKQGIPLDPKMVYQGFNDIVQEDSVIRFSQADGAALINQFANMMEAKTAATNEISGQEFLKQNSRREEVKALESGVQYEVLSEGTGASPRIDNIVKIRVTGQLLDGTLFASSANDADGALEVDISQAVTGLQSALTNMKPGDSWRLWVPAELGYGAENRPPVGPNSLLIYNIELLEIMN